MDDNNKIDWSDLLLPFRLLNFWNSSSRLGNGWFGRLFRFACKLTILVIVVNFLGGFALSMLIEWTQPPCMVSCVDSLDLENENVQLGEWEARKQYWMDTFHINLEDVNKTCRDLNQSWANTNSYLRGKFFEYWNKIDWGPVERSVRSALGTVDLASPAEESN